MRTSLLNVNENGESSTFCIARQIGKPEKASRNDIGHMDSVCISCGAFMWITERKSASSLSQSRFQTCCGDGKCILPNVKPIPESIANLLRGNDNTSKEFRKNIRIYNSATSFTSMNADLDRSVADSRSGAYAFRTHGSVHHLISTTLIPPSQGANESTANRPKFAQIYIFDSENELQNRMNVAANSEVNSATMSILQGVMHDVNLFLQHFQTMEEMASVQQNGIEDIRMVFRADGVPDPRRYNSPTGSEIGILILGGEREGSDFEPANCDIVIRLKGPGNTISRINELNQFYDPLQYVLMFPEGDAGWHLRLREWKNGTRSDIVLEPNTPPWISLP
jgi:hypothetical protein